MRAKHQNKVRGLGFTALDNWILFDKRIGDGALRTYMALRWCAREDGMCYPGQDFLTKARGKSERSILGCLLERIDLHAPQPEAVAQPCSRHFFHLSLSPGRTMTLATSMLSVSPSIRLKWADCYSVAKNTRDQR